MRPLQVTGLALLLLQGIPLAAQDVVTVHRKVAEIRALDEDRLAAGEPVELRGVVVFSSSSGFSVHDGESAIFVESPADVTNPSVGAQVTVIGKSSVIRPSGQPRAQVVATSLSQEGLTAVPDPIETSLLDLSIYRHWDQFVAVEGVVLDQSWSAGEHRLMIGSPQGSAVIHVLDSSSETFRPDLYGARIRARGINRSDGESGCALRVAMTQHWQILTLGTEAPFELPLAKVAAIAASAPGGLVKLRGIVLYQTPQQIYVRDPEGRGFRISTFEPLPKPGTEGKASGITPAPSVSPGDEVEVAGLVAETGQDIGLRYCQVRKIPAPPREPIPVATSIPEIYRGGATNQVVVVSGRLAERQVLKLGGNRYRSILMLEKDSKLLRCQHDSREADPFASFRENDLIEVTGLVPGNPGNEPLYLLIENKEDAISRGLSPEVRVRRFWLWGAFTTLGAILLLLWVLSLRRSLDRAERAEKAERELNATLEDRVNERTAELEAARADLDRALGQERELGALKDRFVAMVSHEFRTPLGVTMSALELLRHHRARLDQEKQGELLDDIFSATLRMSGLMEQILLLGKAESGKMSLNPKPLDLPALVRRIGSETLASQGVAQDIEYQFEGELNPVSLDENLMRLMLGNLLSNAVKYSPAGGPVRLLARRDGASVKIDVSDQGIGIPEQDQPRLFEAFHRATNVGEISGTGLGLLLVKRCAELHQGSISFTSRSGEGTSFHLSLPFGIE